MRTIVWFRGKDLRLDDHQPLQDALQLPDAHVHVLDHSPVEHGRGYVATPTLRL